MTTTTAKSGLNLIKLWAQPSVRMAASAVGLLTFFGLYGLVQERLMTQPYGEEGERFEWTTFLVLVNRMVAVTVTATVLFLQGGSIEPVAPVYKYFLVSLSNTGATYCQYESLRYISFPTTTLVKCSKMIPILIIGSIFGGPKKYTPKDYIIAILITLGCTIFALSGDISAPTVDQSDSWFGLVLVVCFLLMDGFTSTTQERLFNGYPMSPLNQMLYVNLGGGIIVFTQLLVTGDMFRCLDFVLAHPKVMGDSLLLSACGLLGQMTIYFTVREFGALFYGMVMTTRAILSILLSTIVYAHTPTLAQWVAMSLVFCLIFYKNRDASAKKATSSDDAKPKSLDDDSSGSEDEEEEASEVQSTELQVVQEKPLEKRLRPLVSSV
eukprot:TRINITY_DN5862_c0_g1_i2.p1 TRINITY_DN5862_c0_g1~~TRINITY_DN5862_c0_g1_i2.p1  ORF type:complete len:439 (+),score=81.90 TRINITY_DN5862_c0_g1_i2:176-1318(+)